MNKGIYTLEVNNTIVAISHNDMVLAKYVINRRIKNFSIQLHEKKKVINNILKAHSDKIIYNEDDMLTTESDEGFIYELVKEEQYKLDSCLEILEQYINGGYNLKSDHVEILKLAFSILKKKQKTNKFYKFINLDESDISYNLIKSLEEMKGEF